MAQDGNAILKTGDASALIPLSEIGIRQALAPGHLHDNPPLYIEVIRPDRSETDGLQIADAVIPKNSAVSSHIDDARFQNILPAVFMRRFNLHLANGENDVREFQIDKLPRESREDDRPFPIVEWCQLISKQVAIVVDRLHSDYELFNGDYKTELVENRFQEWMALI